MIPETGGGVGIRQPQNRSKDTEQTASEPSSGRCLRAARAEHIIRWPRFS